MTIDPCDACWKNNGRLRFYYKLGYTCQACWEAAHPGKPFDKWWRRLFT